MLKDTWTKLHQAVLDMEPDIDKVDSKQAKASARRARKSAMTIKTLAGDLRKAIQDAIK